MSGRAVMDSRSMLTMSQSSTLPKIYHAAHILSLFMIIGHLSKCEVDLPALEFLERAGCCKLQIRCGQARWCWQAHEHRVSPDVVDECTQHRFRLVDLVHIRPCSIQACNEISHVGSHDSPRLSSVPCAAFVFLILRATACLLAKAGS
jgi:hypothetical protein